MQVGSQSFFLLLSVKVKKKKTATGDSSSGEGGKDLLDFGRYRGVSLQALLREDPRYVLWLARGGSPDNPLQSGLVGQARILTRGKICRRCCVALPADNPSWKLECRECFLGDR